MQSRRLLFSFMAPLYFVCAAFSQPIVLSRDETIAFAQITPIDVDKGTIGEVKKTNLKIEILKEYSAIDKQGVNIVIHGLIPSGIQNSYTLLIANFDQSPKINEVPGYRGGMNPQFSSDGNTIYYISCNQDMTCDWETDYGNYNVLQERTFSYASVFHHERQYIPLLNRNGATLLYYPAVQPPYLLHLDSRKGVDWDRQTFYFSDEIQNPFISESGNRVFFALKNAINKEQQEFYIDKQNGGWSEERAIPSMTISIDGKEEPLGIESIADDGKTLLLKTSHYDFAVTHEIEGGWSEPEFVGNLGDVIDSGYPVEIYHSDDGRAIAAQIIKKMDGRYNPISSDAYIFIKNELGKWNQYKINPDSIEVRMYMLLSGDGKKLVWIPSPNSSTPYFENLH